MKNIAEKINLIQTLHETFGNNWKEYFVLTVYMITTNDPLMYCKDWAQNTECYDVKSNLSSQFISRLLADQESTARDEFFSKWYEERKCDEYNVIDITSESSYSELIDLAEYGYNRDHEQLPQINHCMLIGEKERLPIIQTLFSGSIRDVSTLKMMIEQFKLFLGDTIKTKTLLSDKGFYSKQNIDALLNAGLNFLVAMPFTSKLSFDILDMTREDIKVWDNTIIINNNMLIGTSKEIQWDEKNIIYAYVFYNPTKAINAKTELHTKYAETKDIILANPKPYYDAMLNDSIREKIKRSKDPNEKKSMESQLRHVETNDLKVPISEVRGMFHIEEIVEGSEYSVTTDMRIAEEKLKSSGGLIILSNQKKKPSEVISAYRDKDVVEKVFLRNKNFIDLNRLRVHGNKALHAKMFLGFIASILMCYINKIMAEKNLYKKYTMYEMVKKLEGLRVQEIKGNKLLYPCTKEQREIFDAFAIEYPDKNGPVIS